MLFSTAEDSFNVFRPNLDPEDEEIETTQETSGKVEESKQDKKERKRTDYAVESDEDME
jgi:hypothetical protein